MSALINPNTVAADPIKPRKNIGAGLDILTGKYVKGKRGEHILNGGLAHVTGVVGIGNNFKSTFMDFMTLTAMSRSSIRSATETYDTEVNIDEDHKRVFVNRAFRRTGEDILETGRWKVTDGVVYHGDEWYREHKKFLLDKRHKMKDITVETPFLARDGVSFLKMLVPTYSQIDSFTEFTTSDVDNLNDKADLGDSSANPLHMRQGLSKLRLLMDAPALNAGASNYAILTAHIGKESAMNNAGPAGQVPVVTLKHLKNGDKIKGTTNKFTYATHSCWHCYDATPLIHKEKKTPLYPRDADDDLALDTDLNELKVRNLRCKSGPSGLPFIIIVSQSEGVLPELTEYHHLRKQGGWGFEGSDVSHYLSIYPEQKMGRTTIRALCDENETLARALNITSEMCQIDYLWHDAKDVMCTPKQLYDDLKDMGYDWGTLLDTRGWWTTLENEEGLPPYLSTWDLLLMRLGEYIPFWFTPEQKASIDLSKAKKRKVVV